MSALTLATSGAAVATAVESHRSSGLPVDEAKFTNDDGAVETAAFQELFDHIRVASPLAAVALYRTFGRGLRFYLRRQLDAADTDDLVYLILLRVARAVRQSKIRQAGLLPGYVCLIAREQVAEQRKRDCPLTTPMPSARDERAVDILNQVMTELAPREREVLVRFYLLNQPEQQITRELNIAPAAILDLKCKARKRFHELSPAREPVTSVV